MVHIFIGLVYNNLLLTAGYHKDHGYSLEIQATGPQHDALAKYHLNPGAPPHVLTFMHKGKQRVSVAC